MFTFKVLLLLGVTCVFPTTQALKCHVCSNTDEHCLDNPVNYLKDVVETPPSGKDYYCYTESATLVGFEYISRNYETRSEKQDDFVIKGPLGGTMNPEENYIHVRYCKTDGCNTHPYVLPPKVKSTIKCYVCDESNEDCAVNVASRYLIDADPIPDRGTSKSGALNATKALRSLVGDIAPFEWETLCVTKISSDGGVYARGVSWSTEGDERDGSCYRDNSEGDKTCYCKSRNGCNDQNGSEVVRASFFAVGIFFTLTNQVFLWGK